MNMDVAKYSNDFFFLKELRAFLRSYLENDINETDFGKLRKGIYSTLKDGRSIRYVIPNVPRAKTSNLDDIYFVGFIGFVNQTTVTPALLDRVWELDKQLVDDLSQHDDVVAYVTAERTKDGDWGNLVLMKSVGVIESWRKGSAHQIAVQEISPQFYRTVRIHRGKFHKEEENTYQTLFLDYTTTPTKRWVEKWQ